VSDWLILLCAALIFGCGWFARMGWDNQNDYADGELAERWARQDEE